MEDGSKDAPFFRIESLAVMGNHTPRNSEASSLNAGEDTQSSHEPTHPSPSAATLVVQPLRSRALVATVVVVGALVALMLVFIDGVALKTFRAGDFTAAEQTKLLDDYNSYSGNVATLFSKPVELFVGLSVQLLVLSFLADAVVRPTPRWTVSVVALALSSGVGYLMRNGIGALNVQLHVLETRPMVGASDLSALANGSATSAASSTSTVARVLSEARPQNPAANTIFRNLLLPPPTTVVSQCATAEDAYQEEIVEPSLAFGIPRLDWQSRVLPEALNATQRLRMVVDASAPAPAGRVVPAPAELPMDAAVAADLFLYATIEAPRRLPWGQQLGFAFWTDWYTRFPLTLVTGREVRSEVGSMADFTGVLPPANQRADETAQRAWFLKQLVPSAIAQFNQSTNSSKTGIALEFSRVDISPTLRFDALTIEAEVDPRRLSNANGAGGVRYTNIPLGVSCGPWPGVCMFKKTAYSAATTEYSSTATDFDAPSLVETFSPCADENGDEKLTFMLNNTVRGFFYTVQCPQRSKSSIYSLSIAKRLVADSLVQNKSMNASGTFADTTSAVATNLRKIYSFTIGRLSWKLENLADTFHAECHVGSCLGLQLPLAPQQTTATTSANASTQEHQRLVVGVDGLPLDQLYAYPSFLYDDPRRVTVARVHDPNQASLSENETYLSGDVLLPKYLAGDQLLPHNIGNLTWSRNATTFQCKDVIENRLRLGVDSHLYMEQSLQPAYTAATLFLFQRAVVKTEIAFGDVKSLDFEANARPIALWISIPTQNTVLTLAGCALLVICVAAAVWGASPALAHISAPQTIACVMLDEKKFPPLLLHREVALPNDHGEMAMEELDNFQIAALSLEPTSEEPPVVGPTKDDTDRFSHKA